MVASSSDDIFFDIPSGVRSLNILDDLKVHILVASQQQLSTMCSVGIVDIRWHNDTVVCGKLLSLHNYNGHSIKRSLVQFFFV